MTQKTTAPRNPIVPHVILLRLGPVAGARALVRHGATITCVLTAAEETKAMASGLIKDSVIVGDTADAEGVVSALVRCNLKTNGAVVTTGNEFPIVTTSVVGGALGLRSLPLARTLPLRDKFLQKNLMKDFGIPAAEARIIYDVSEPSFSSFMDERPPIIVKPFADAGTRGTSLVRSRGELLEFIDAAIVDGTRGPWLLEEYIEGDEYHIDGAVRNGRVLFFGLSHYLDNPINVRSGGLFGSFVLDPYEAPELYREAQDLTTQVMHALNHRDGVFHLEVFRRGDRFIFGECAGRVGGGLIAEVIDRKFGVDLHDEWARSVLDIPSTIKTEYVAEQHYGWIHLPAPPGRLVSLPTAEELKSLPGVLEVEVRLSVGDEVGDCSQDSAMRVARALIAGTTDEEVAVRLKATAKWFEERVRVIGRAN